MEPDNQPSQSAKRMLVWVRRMVALLLTSLVLIALLAFNGYHPGLVGVITSFTFAEFTRRIMAEQHPERAMSWIDIFRYGFDMDSGPSNGGNKKDDG